MRGAEDGVGFACRLAIARGFTQTYRQTDRAIRRTALVGLDGSRVPLVANAVPESVDVDIELEIAIEL